VKKILSYQTYTHTPAIFFYFGGKEWRDSRDLYLHG